MYIVGGTVDVVHPTVLALKKNYYSYTGIENIRDRIDNYKRLTRKFAEDFLDLLVAAGALKINLESHCSHLYGCIYIIEAK